MVQEFVLGHAPQPGAKPGMTGPVNKSLDGAVHPLEDLLNEVGSIIRGQSLTSRPTVDDRSVDGNKPLPGNRFIRLDPTQQRS